MQMKVKTLIRAGLLVALAVAALPAAPERSDAYFHNGANYYINGKLYEALAEVEKGLQQKPEDPKLNELYQKIQEELKKQQPQPQDQKQQQDEQQSDDSQQQEQDRQQKQDEQQKNKPDEQPSQEQRQQAEQQIAENQEEISKEDAERILNALENQEKQLQKNRKLRGKRKRRSAKDW